MATSTVGLSMNQADLKRIVKKLESLPKGVRRNAATSALNAGAKVIRDKARSKAPSCIKRSIKNVRLKQENGDPVTAIAAGVGMLKPDNAWMKNFDKASKSVLGKETPCVAVWLEFGTYGRRDLGKDPYAPATMRRYSKYGGRSPSPFWAIPPMWIPATPFMRPAMMEASRDGSVERAMVKKLDEYFMKLGV